MSDNSTQPSAEALKAAEEAEIATWPPHMQENYRRSMQMRAVVKKIAENQK